MVAFAGLYGAENARFVAQAPQFYQNLGLVMLYEAESEGSRLRLDGFSVPVSSGIISFVFAALPIA